MIRWVLKVGLLLALVGCDPQVAGDEELEGRPAEAVVASEPATELADDPGDAARLGDRPPRFSSVMPGGHPQQLPDAALEGAPAVLPRVAVAEALRRLERRREALGDGVVLVAGMDHHGVPMVPESTDPADLAPDTPAILVDPAALDPATTYADCLGVLKFCSTASATMDGCIDAVPECTTERPWEVGEACCPAGAVEGYRAARTGGAPWARAFVESVVNGREHFPGLSEVYDAGGVQ